MGYLIPQKHRISSIKKAKKQPFLFLFEESKKELHMTLLQAWIDRLFSLHIRYSYLYRYCYYYYGELHIVFILFCAHVRELFTLGYWRLLFSFLSGMAPVEMLLFIAIFGLIVFLGSLLLATLLYPAYWFFFERKISRRICKIERDIKAWDVTINAFKSTHHTAP